MTGRRCVAQTLMKAIPPLGSARPTTVVGLMALWSIGALLLVAGVLAVLALVRDRDAP
jgi:hypothetical protein